MYVYTNRYSFLRLSWPHKILPSFLTKPLHLSNLHLSHRLINELNVLLARTLLPFLCPNPHLFLQIFYRWAVVATGELFPDLCQCVFDHVTLLSDEARDGVKHVVVQQRDQERVAAIIKYLLCKNWRLLQAVNMR